MSDALEVNMPTLVPLIVATVLSGTNVQPARRARKTALPGFAIYLVANQGPRLGPTLGPLSGYRLEAQPLLTEADLEAYHWRDHRLEIKRASLQRLCRQGKLLLLNRIFVVTVGRQKIYAGVFWSDFYSSSRSHPVAMQRPGGYGIERAYPTPAFSVDPDPRIDPRIAAALKHAGVWKP